MFREIFSGKSGRLSSKRILGAMTLVFSLGLTIAVFVTASDHGILLYPYGAVGVLLGAGAFEGIGQGAR